MSKTRTQQEALAGKLISAVQKCWSEQAGEPQAEESEKVMHASHSLLQAAKAGTLEELLGKKSVIERLGLEWFQANPSALPSALALQESVNGRTQ